MQGQHSAFVSPYATAPPLLQLQQQPFYNFVAQQSLLPAAATTTTTTPTFDSSQFDAPPKVQAIAPDVDTLSVAVPPPPAPPAQQQQAYEAPPPMLDETAQQQQAYEAPPPMLDETAPLVVAVVVPSAGRQWTRGPLLLAKIGERIAHAYPLGVIVLSMSVLLCALSLATLHLTNHMPGV